MPPTAKKRSGQAKDGPPSKKHRADSQKSPSNSINHIVELLSHSELRDLVLDLVDDPAISASVIEHLCRLEDTAAHTTYDALLQELEDFETEVASARYGQDIWGLGGIETPDFSHQIDLLCKAGQQGLELAWQALLRIADTYKHNGEQGYEERDGPTKFDDDEFHWEIDSLMLECCIDLEAESPEDLHPERRIRELKKLRNKITRSYPDLAYRYYFTISYLKWFQNGKVGNYEEPKDYDQPEPARPRIISPRVAGVRTKQTARKQAPSYMRSSRYRLAFAGRGNLFEDESSGDGEV